MDQTVLKLTIMPLVVRGDVRHSAAIRLRAHAAESRDPNVRSVWRG